MTDLTIAGLALKTDQLLSRVDALLLGQVLIATQEYQTATTDSDPGAGNFRLNHATLANVTAGYFDDMDTGGTSIAPLIDTYDDSSSAVKGTLLLKSLSNEDNWAAYRVSGAVVDGTGYRKLTLGHIVSNGTWTAEELFSQAFYRAGDVGQPNTLEIGTVEEGAAAATITGDAPSQTLNLVIPKGDPGETGPAPEFEIGTVEEGEANVVLLGTSPNYVLNFTVPKGETGNTGPRGFSLIYGAGPPDNATGSNSEFYIDTEDFEIYGPKAFGVWPAGISIVGPPGDTGDPGADANTILNGAGAPGSGVGVNGDFYIDTTALEIYGPKSVAGWGDPQDIRGPSGSGAGDVTGPTGATTNRLAVFEGSTGKIIKDGGITVAGIQANLDGRTGANTVATADFTFTAYAPRVIIDTTAGAVTATLPASPATGARVEFADGADFSVNALTIARNSQLVEGLAENVTVNTQGQAGGFVFVGGPTGWKAFKA